MIIICIVVLSLQLVEDTEGAGGFRVSGLRLWTPTVRVIWGFTTIGVPYFGSLLSGDPTIWGIDFRGPLHRKPNCYIGVLTSVVGSCEKTRTQPQILEYPERGHSSRELPKRIANVCTVLIPSNLCSLLDHAYIHEGGSQASKKERAREKI